MGARAQQVGRIPAQAGLGSFVCALATATTVATVAIVGSGWGGDTVGYAAERELPSALLVVVALAALAVSAVPWLLLGDRAAHATWLAIAAVTSQLPVWSGWTELPASWRAVVLAGTFLVPGAVAAALARPDALGVAALVAGAGGALLHAAAFDPFRVLDCYELRTCLAADPLLSGKAAEPVLAAATGLGLLAAVAGLGRVITARAPAAPRIAGCVAVAAAAAILVTGRRPVEVAGAAFPSDVLLALAVAAVALVLGAEQVRTRRTRRAVDRLIHQLEAAEEAADGAAEATSGLPDSSTLTAAQRLALQNAQLTARSRASLSQTRALQRQTQQRADDERERIERDLHDGAQQQLVSTAIQLSLASSTASTSASACTEVFASARGDTLAALEALREIAHGPFPGSLGDEGLLVALEDLCADHGARLEVGSPVPAALDVQVGRAAYAVVEALLADSADSADGGNAADAADAADGELVQVQCRGDELILAVDQPLASLPLDVADRLQSVGGTVVAGPASTEVVIPCAW